LLNGTSAHLLQQSDVEETIVTSTPKQDKPPSATPKRKLSGAARLIFSRLAKQNRGLNTSGWRVLYRKEQRRTEGEPLGQPDGQLLVLGVDDESLKVLREL